MTETEATALRDHFLGWQCRIRQHAMRHDAGRPAPGMRPRVMAFDGDELASGITVILIEREPSESIAMFRHICKKTHDPAKRHDEAVRVLSATYYQRPRRFSGILTATFGSDSALTTTLLGADRCVLEFAQFSQRYRLPCAVRDVAQADPAYQASYWHNAMFNPALPPAIRVLAFAPDWLTAEAEPPL
jgi:hypothetical protein